MESDETEPEVGDVIRWRHNRCPIRVRFHRMVDVWRARYFRVFDPSHRPLSLYIYLLSKKKEEEEEEEEAEMAILMNLRLLEPRVTRH